MATPTSPQLLSDARYSVLADLGRGESVARTASFLVMSGWAEADALVFVQKIKDGKDPFEEPQVEEDEPVMTAEELPQDVVVEPVVPQEETPFRKARRVREVSEQNMTTGINWMVGGAVLTGLGYFVAREAGGGGYMVFSGAILYGAVRYYVGYSGCQKAKRMSRDAQEE